MDFSAKQLHLTFEAKTLLFKRPSGTSRGILIEKKLWIFTLTDEHTGLSGIGECSIIPGLSPDYTSDEQYSGKLTEVCSNPIHFFENKEALAEFPSILFGLESAFIDLKNGGKQHYFTSDFTERNAAIPINGLIWMGDENFMNEQIEEKLTAGFSCIKMKVGALDFETEFSILSNLAGSKVKALSASAAVKPLSIAFLKFVQNTSAPLFPTEEIEKGMLFCFKRNGLEGANSQCFKSLKGISLAMYGS